MPDQGAAFVNYGLDMCMNTKCRYLTNLDHSYELKRTQPTPRYGQ